MAEKIFIDTSAFYALMVQADSAHDQVVSALSELRAGRVLWFTSDYIMDESAALLNARGYHSAAMDLLNLVDKSRALQIEWMDGQRFATTRRLFAKYREHGFSFTDCFSFSLKRELKMKKALTKDHHFTMMGFEELLS